MSRLHIVGKSPFTEDTLPTCLAHALAGDALLLTGDGVYAVLSGDALNQAAKAGVAVYALGPDVLDRGLADRLPAGGISLVDYAGFVDLAAAHKTTETWL